MLLLWKESVRLLSQHREARASVDTLSTGGGARSELLPLYSKAVADVSRAGRWRIALKLLQTMERDGLPPDSYCYSQAMMTCRRNGKWSISLRLLEDLRKSGAPPDPCVTCLRVSIVQRTSSRPSEPASGKMLFSKIQQRHTQQASLPSMRLNRVLRVLRSSARDPGASTHTPSSWM